MEIQEVVARGLGRVEGKLDILISQFSTHAQDDKNNFEVIFRHLASAEKKISWILGLGAGFTVFIGLIASYIKH